MLSAALTLVAGGVAASAVDPENSSNLYVDVSFRGRAGPGQQFNYFFRPPTAGGIVEHHFARLNFPQHQLRRHLERNLHQRVRCGVSTDAHRAGMVYVTITEQSNEFGAPWTSLASRPPPQLNRFLSVATDPNDSNVPRGAGEGCCSALRPE